MSKSNPLIFILGLTLTTSTFAARPPADLREEELGRVVAVKRTFTIDLNKCGATWKWTAAREGWSSSQGSCDVAVIPEKAGEDGVGYGPSQQSYPETVPGEGQAPAYASSTARENGYSLFFQSSVGDADFANARPMIEALIRAKFPDGKISLIVQAIK